MASSDSSPLAASHDTPKEHGAGSSTSHYRFRADLQIIRGDEADITASDVTVIDHRSGTQHVFTADEYRLCQAADGVNTLAAIRHAFKAATGREMTHGKVFALFSRLRKLGLLEVSAGESHGSEAANTPIEQASPTAFAEAHAEGITARPSATQAGSDTKAASIGVPTPSPPRLPEETIPPQGQPALEKPSEPIAIGAGGDRRRARLQRLMQSRRKAETALRSSGEEVPVKTGQSQVSSAIALAEADAEGVAAPPAATQMASDAKAAGTEPFAPSPPRPPEENTSQRQPAPEKPFEPAAIGLGGDRRRARRQRLMQSRRQAETAVRSADEAVPAKTEKSPVSSALVPSVAEKSSAQTDAGKHADGREPLEGRKKSSPAGRAAGGRRQRREANVVADAELPVAPGGPAGPRPPGDTGGLVAPDDDDFAAALGAGMDTGEFGAMLGGRLAGRGRGGGMQNFLAGVAARARAREDVETKEKEPARVRLFNPNALLGVLAALTWPLKYFFVPLLLLVPVCAGIAYQQRATLAQDIRTLDVSVVGTVILALVIVNLICRLTQGTFIRAFGGTVKECGVALTFVIPRFFVDLGGIAELNRRGQLWVHAAPPIARLTLFCAGTILWIVLRETAPWPAHLALIVGQIGLFAFLLSAWPLLPSDGYRWLATYFGRPTLRADALATLPGQSPQATEEEEDPTAEDRASSAVTFYVLAVALAGAELALVLQAYSDVAQTGAVGLLTAALLVGVSVALAAWVIALWRQGRRYTIEALDADATQRVLSNWTGQADVASGRPLSIGSVGKVFWAAVACVLLAVAFLPYHYDPAGMFEILPAERTAVTALTSGELKEVLVHEGDWVKANQPLAKLSSEDQQREITITRAELDRAKAQLARFGDSSTTPEGDPGLEALNKSIADAFADEPDSASGKNNATAANYNKTQAERAARADVERLTHKLAFERDQLANTTVRAPKDGRVMTPNIHLMTGIYLRRGTELLTLADTRTLEAQIDIPEADIGLVKVGDKVRVRPWSDEDREIVGTATEIAPAAQTRPYGTIVRVRASIPNDEASLRPGMTGYAKIDSGERVRVWEAFLGRIIRTVRVEMWSWIP